MPDEIIIKIKRRKKRRRVSTPPVAAPNGIITTRRENDYQARRLSNGGYLNFYDLGQIKSGGAWTDFVFSRTRDDFETNPAAVRAALNVALDTARSQWQMKFRRIGYEDSVKYRFSIGLNGAQAATVKAGAANWTNKGLKILDDLTAFDFHSHATNAGNFVFFERVGGLFQNWQTASDSVKITAAPVFASPSVALSILKNKSANVFLNVAACSAGGGRTNSYSQGGYDWNARVRITTGHWDSSRYPSPPFLSEPLPPETYAFEQSRRAESSIDADSFHFGSSYADVVSLVANWRRSSALAIYSEHPTTLAADNQAITALVSGYGAHGYKRVETDYGVTARRVTYNPDYPLAYTEFPYFRGTWRGFTDRDWETMPGYNEAPSGTRVDSSITYSLDADDDAAAFQGFAVDVPAGTLLAAVNQGNDWFYIWKQSGGGSGEGIDDDMYSSNTMILGIL